MVFDYYLARLFNLIFVIQYKMVIYSYITVLLYCLL